jgi:hypothetical protein
MRYEEKSGDLHRADKTNTTTELFSRDYVCDITWYCSEVAVTGATNNEGGSVAKLLLKYPITRYRGSIFAFQITPEFCHYEFPGGEFSFYHCYRCP